MQEAHLAETSDPAAALTESSGRCIKPRRRHRSVRSTSGWAESPSLLLGRDSTRPASHRRQAEAAWLLIPWSIARPTETPTSALHTAVPSIKTDRDIHVPPPCTSSLNRDRSILDQGRRHDPQDKDQTRSMRQTAETRSTRPGRDKIHRTRRRHPSDRESMATVPSLQTVICYCSE